MQYPNLLAVIPPLTTYPEILLKIGCGGKSDEMPSCLKDKATSSAVTSFDAIF